MISKIQLQNINLHFNNSSNSKKSELIEHNNEYQKKIKDYRRDAFLDFLISLGVSSFLFFTGNKKSSRIN